MHRAAVRRVRRGARARRRAARRRPPDRRRRRRRARGRLDAALESRAVGRRHRALAGAAAPMTLAVGLNPYGLSYTLGLGGNPDGAGLRGFLEIADEIGAHVVELHQPWLDGLDVAALRLDGMVPVISCGLDPAGDDAALECAVALGASVVRMALTRVLQGDRHAVDWPRLVDGVRARLARVAPRAAAAGLSVAIENHQDFTSADLMELCEEAGEAVGIALDTGNAFAVGEAPPRGRGTCTSRTTGCSPPTRDTASCAARSATARSRSESSCRSSAATCPP